MIDIEGAFAVTNYRGPILIVWPDGPNVSVAVPRRRASIAPEEAREFAAAMLDAAAAVDRAALSAPPEEETRRHDPHRS